MCDPAEKLTINFILIYNGWIGNIEFVGLRNIYCYVYCVVFHIPVPNGDNYPKQNIDYAAPLTKPGMQR